MNDFLLFKSTILGFSFTETRVRHVLVGVEWLIQYEIDFHVT